MERDKKKKMFDNAKLRLHTPRAEEKKTRMIWKNQHPCVWETHTSGLRESLIDQWTLPNLEQQKKTMEGKE